MKAFRAVRKAVRALADQCLIVTKADALLAESLAQKSARELETLQ